MFDSKKKSQNTRDLLKPVLQKNYLKKSPVKIYTEKLQT